MSWTAGEPDAVVRTRLRNASVIHGLHEERVFLGLTLARADVPGSAVSAAGFGAGEEQVHVRLDVRLLPPQVRPQTCCRWGSGGVSLSAACRVARL